MAANAWFITGPDLSALFTPGSGRSPCNGTRSATALRGGAEKRIRFTSNILPRWARRSRSLDALLPVLYLRGVSMGDFQEALTALLGPDAPDCNL